MLTRNNAAGAASKRPRPPAPAGLHGLVVAAVAPVRVPDVPGPADPVLREGGESGATAERMCCIVRRPT